MALEDLTKKSDSTRMLQMTSREKAKKNSIARHRLVSRSRLWTIISRKSWSQCIHILGDLHTSVNDKHRCSLSKHR